MGVQTMLFSATWPKEVQKLALDLCKTEPVHVHIGEGRIGELKANDRITQRVELLQDISDVRNNQYGCATSDYDSYKIDRIAQIVQEERTRATDEASQAGGNGNGGQGAGGNGQQQTQQPVVFKTIIFCMTKKGCEMVSRRLHHLGAMAIHGDKTQQ